MDQGQSLTATDLAAWARTAHPGDRCVYFTGYLARSKGTERLASTAYALQRDGLVNLLQQRVAPEIYAYIAQRRAACEQDRPPSPAPEHSPGRKRRQQAARQPAAEKAFPKGHAWVESELNMIVAMLRRDLTHAQAKLSKVAPGDRSYAATVQFVRQCERALQMLGC